MISTLRFTLLASAFAVGISSFAQPGCLSQVDISVVPNENDQLEIWLRPQNDFDGFFSSIVFTVRWNNDDGVSLGAIMAQPPYVGLGTSGPEHEDDIYSYQIYWGESLAQLAVLDETWTAGEQFLLAKINILNNTSYFEIGDDDFTDSMNGTYYVSLNGYPCTGDIYTISTQITEMEMKDEVVVSPNPSSGQSFATVSLASVTDLRFELYDATGKLIWNKERKGRSGRHVEDLSMKGLSEGIYMLQVWMGDKPTTHRIVLTR